MKTEPTLFLCIHAGTSTGVLAFTTNVANLIFSVSLKATIHLATLLLTTSNILYKKEFISGNKDQ